MTKYKLEVSFLEYESNQGYGWTPWVVIIESCSKTEYERFLKYHGDRFDHKHARLHVTETTITAHVHKQVKK